MSSDASDKLKRLAAISREARAEMKDSLKGKVRDFVLQSWSDITENLSNKVLRRRTGRLATSIKADMQEPGNSFLAKFGTNVPYARIHEEGGKTPAHVIAPRRKSVLAFVSGGKTVFAKIVNHPGSRIPARPYFKPAILQNRDRLADNIDLLIEKIVGKFSNV